MSIHTVQVRCEGTEYDPWFIDEDTTNIVLLVEAIEEDLKSKDKHDQPVHLHITARINGGEHVIHVHDDATVVEMFKLNTNSGRVILLDVQRVLMNPLAIYDPITTDDDPIEIIEPDEAHNPAPDGVDDVVGNDETVRANSEEDEAIKEGAQRDDEEENRDVEVQVEIETVAEIPVNVESYVAPNVETDVHVDASAEVEVEVELEPDLDVHVEPDVDMESEFDVEPDVDVEADVESDVSQSDDSYDPDWNDGNIYTDDEESSEDISDMVVSSADEIYSEDEDVHRPFHRVNSEEGALEPNSNLPQGVPHIGADGRINLGLWQRFDDNRHFMSVLLDYCIQEGFQVVKKKNDRLRVTASCKTEQCPWRIHASRSPDGTFFVVKTYSEEHTCQQVRKNQHVKPLWVAKKIMGLLKHDSKMSVQSIRGHLMDTYDVEVDRRTVWRGRAIAKEQLFGSHSESFSKLRCYANMVLQTNPGSVAIIHSQLNPQGPSSQPPRFKRIFICYHAASQGFVNGCRPFLGLDGCHLKGPLKCILMSAVGIDPNLQFYPVAYGIVEVENHETWKWFIEQLKDVIGETMNGLPWTIMSDRQKGLVEAVSCLPRSIHRYCAWHIWQNFKLRFSGTELKKLYWRAANTANFNEHRNILQAIRSVNVEAFQWLSDIDAKHWSRSKFEHSTKVDQNTNNHTESFNGWVDEHRYNPPIQLLEGLRESHTQLLYTRHVTSTRYTGSLPPKVRKLLNEASRKSRHCIVRRCGEYEFQVEFNEFKGTVRLDDKFCECEMWQVSGIPCVHAMSCINTVRAPVEGYCDPFFSVERWRECYAGIVHLIPSENLWPPFENCELLPPLARPLPGRPKRRRRRMVGETVHQPGPVSSTKRCKACNAYGHNRRTCNASRRDMPTPSNAAQRDDRARRTGGSRRARRNVHPTQEEVVLTQPTPTSQV